MKKRWMSVLATGMTAVCVLNGCGTKVTDNGKTTPEPTQSVSEENTPVPTVLPTGTSSAESGLNPIVTLGEYKGLTLYEVDASVVAEEMRNLLEKYGEYVTVNRAAQENDAVNINYVGKKDGVAFEGGTQDSEEGYNLVLGSDTFIDGFEDGLIGAVAGEVRDLKLTFPETYRNSELAGQEVVFTVTVNAVKEWVTPELTDAFVAENLNYETTAELIIALYDKLNKNSYYEQISKVLLESSQVENFPLDMVEAEKQEIIEYYTSYAEYFGAYYGMDTETVLASVMGFSSLDVLNAYAEEYAYELVKNELIIEKVFEQELTEEDYQKSLSQYLEYYDMEEQDFYENYGGEETVRLQIKSNLVFDYIISVASIVKAEGDANVEYVE